MGDRPCRGVASWSSGRLGLAGILLEQVSSPSERLGRATVLVEGHPSWSSGRLGRAAVLPERASWPGGRLARAGVFPKRATGGALCALPFARLRRAGLESCAVLVHG